ncbi:MAG: GGDEF domain-containing protein, partial [Halanaerobiaceae bacterium]
MEAFLNKFKYAVIIILALILMFISYTNYQSIKNVIRGKYESRQQLVEKNILQTVDHVRDSYGIVETLLNQEMQEYSQVMREKYREDPNVMDWDLEELKDKFGDYEIYVIDSNLKIIKTTCEEDLGLDFSRYGSFSKELKKRLEGDSFAVDRLDLATQTGEVKKYSYMPTPDNKYLLELSIEAQDKFPSLERMNMFADATDLTKEYEMVEEISFYSVEPNDHQVAKLRSSKKPYLQPDVSEIEDELARQAILTNEAQTRVSETAENNYTYRFFPALVAGEDGGWNSYVVGITYNDRVMLREISRHRNLFSLNIAIMILIFIGYIAMVLYFLRKFEHQAYHDQLTGLADRELFVEEFARLKKEADRRGEKVGIVFLDVDGFKMINDNFGHDTGDRVLKDIAS